MLVADVPGDDRSRRAVLAMARLLARAEDHQRGSWIALSGDCAWRKASPGIYIVRWPCQEAPTFLLTPGKALYAGPTAPADLVRKWKSIAARAATDVVYVGKGNCLRDRVRDLAMFGVGRHDKHKGGEWMWQIAGIEGAEVVLITCPQGKQVAFENVFLERFEKEHGAYPLANRDGPEGPDRWWPGDPA